MPEERRKHRRLEIHLPLECRRRSETDCSYRTVTLNVSTGGLCFETDAEDLRPGELVDVELTVPAGDGHWPWPGRVHATGEVVRVTPSEDRPLAQDARPRFAVAARFRESLKLKF